MKKYFPFLKAGMMQEMAYKAGLFIWMLITALQLVCIVFLWVAVYANAVTPVINGFTFKEVIVYFIITNIFAFMCLENETMYGINEEIKDGTIAISFIKPISYRLRFLFRTFGTCLFRLLIMGIPTLTVSFIIFIKMGYLTIASIAEFTAHIALFLIAMIFAVALFDTVNYICGVLCFYTTAAWGLNFTKNVIVNFFSGVLLPLSFFPGKMAKIAEILPFAGLSQNPVFILISRVDINTSFVMIGKEIMWFIIFEIIAKILFNHASKKVTVQGG